MNKTYIIDGLGCANCAAKMERKIQTLPEIENASIVFATKQLRITADDPDALVPQMEKICQSIENHVKVVQKDAVSPVHAVQNAHAHEHHHDHKACDCGHDHSHSGKPGKQSFFKEHSRDLISIAAGTVLFAAGIIINNSGILAASADASAGAFPVTTLIPLVIFGLAYLILGGEVLMTAGRNITRGQIFDENFLMSIATIAAFCIGDFAEGAGVMLFYRIGEFFEHVAVEKSRSQIMEAVDMRPETVLLVTGSDTVEIPAQQAKPGDILMIRPGDRIPLDGIVTEGESRIDTSPVTGEPVPVRAFAGCEIISGCVNENGLLKMKVEKPLAESMVTRILDSVENAAAGKPKMDKFITRFARVYTPIVVCLAVLTAIVPSLITGQWSEWIKTAITFLVISCPCALVISVPLAFFSGIGAASKLGILFKGGMSIEALKKAKTVIMDKTGTITRGDFAVQKVLTANGVSESELLLIAAACEAGSTHPIALSIMQKAHELAADAQNEASHVIAADADSAASDIASAAESHIGLTYDTNSAAICSADAAASVDCSCTSAEHKAAAAKFKTAAIEIEEIPGKGIRAQLASGEALCGNAALLAEYGINIPSSISGTNSPSAGTYGNFESAAVNDAFINPANQTKISAAGNNINSDTQPEFSAAGTLVYIALAGKYMGCIIISDTLKTDAARAIATLKSAGLVPAMLTGDNRQSAEAVASASGIAEVRAELLPEDKLTALKQLRSKHGPAMFVGDGINDAPVLAGADVGAAMGTGADAAIEAADVVFMNSSVEAIPQSIAIAKATGRIAIQNVIFALAIKLLVILLGLAGFANIWAAIFADTGVAMLCILNSLRILWKKF